MRVCVVPTMFPKYLGDYYGSFVYDEVKALVQKGLDVHVVTPHNQGAAYQEIMEGIHVHRFRWMEPKPFRALVHFKGLIDTFRIITYSVSLFFNLIVITRKYKIQIIHAHSAIPTGFIGAIVSKIMNIPLFITAHGMDITNFENQRFFNYFISYSLNSSHKSIAVSEDLARKLKSLVNNENKIIVIRNGVDTNRFKPKRNTILRNRYGIKENDILILFVGYLDTFKGIFETINAFKAISYDNINVKLMIVGTGPKENDLKTKVEKMGLEKSVIFTGNIPPADIHEYYQSADIFVLPSYTDAGGPPLVFIEAMACGLPVIGTNVGGIPEGIENGVNGFIIHPKNVNELTKKLDIIINNENLRKEFGKNSLRKIQENSMTLEKKAEKIMDLYKNQIRNHSL